MLLLHGSFATGRWWELFLDLLPDAICAAAPDLRGCGASDKPDHGYEIEVQAEDIAAFLRAWGRDEVDLVAHAGAGAVAIEVVLRYPHRVRTLTLVDSVPIEGAFTPLEVLRLLDQMQTDRMLLERALAALMPTYPGIYPDAPAHKTAFFQQLVQDAQTMAPAAFTGIATALGRWNRFDEARRLTLPTLLIWGDQDIVVDRDATTRTLIAIPGAANLEVIRGVGHSPMIESPLALAERIVNFITDDFDEFESVRGQAD